MYIRKSTQHTTQAWCTLILLIGLIISAVSAIAGCGSDTATPKATTVDYVNLWATNVLHNADAADDYRPLAKKLCSDVTDGSMTNTDLHNLVTDPPQSLTAAQMLTFEYASIKQYCPSQLDALPIEHDAAPTM